MNIRLLLSVITVFSFVLTSCDNGAGEADSHDGYTVSGKVFNAPTNMVYLDHVRAMNQVVPIDTATIAEDGTFEMQGYTAEKGVYLLRLSPQLQWLMVLDNNEVQANIDASNPQGYIMKGNKATELITAYIREVNARQQAIQQANEQFRQAAMARQDANDISIKQQAVMQKMEDFQNYVKQFADTVSSPVVALFATNMLEVDPNLDYLIGKNEYFQKELPELGLTQELNAKVEKKARLANGREAPEIVMKNPQGEEQRLSDTRGKVVLLDFWASWCKPCRVENPNVVKTYEKYKDDGFTIFSVSLDQNLNKWVDAIKADNLKWNWHVSDLKGWKNDAAALYGVQSIPATFLLDKDGKIIARNLRGNALELKLQEIYGY